MARMQSSMSIPMGSQSLSSASTAGLGWEGLDVIASTTLTSAAASFSFPIIGVFAGTANVNLYHHMRILGYFKNDASECDILFEWAGDATTSKYVSATMDSVTRSTGPVRISGTYTSSLAGMRMGHLYANDSCVIDVLGNNITNTGYHGTFQSYCGTHDDDDVYVNWSGGDFYNAGSSVDLSELEVKATAGSFAAGTTLAIIGNRYGATS